MIQAGDEDNMKLSMKRQIAILKASSEFTVGEMILYDATVNDPKQTDKTWRPPAEKLSSLKERVQKMVRLRLTTTVERTRSAFICAASSTKTYNQLKTEMKTIKQSSK